MSSLSRINIYPIKSLDGMSLQAAKILPSGALEHDRGYAIFDEHGELVNGKRTAQVHWLRSSFDLNARTVSVKVQGRDRQKTFHIDDDRQELELWLGEYFGFPMELKRIPLGLPDHGLTPGPTVISTASLERVAEWFYRISILQARNRFRVNLEIIGEPAFWEDRLVGQPGPIVEFQVGEVRIQGVKPCERCVVPSRDPFTGEAYHGFQKLLAENRKEAMPPWAELSPFHHFYHFCVLTRIPKTEASKVLRVEDEVQVREVARRSTPSSASGIFPQWLTPTVLLASLGSGERNEDGRYANIYGFIGWTPGLLSLDSWKYKRTGTKPEVEPEVRDQLPAQT